MLALIIISGVIVYAFIGLTVFHFWYAFNEKRCGRCESIKSGQSYGYCPCEHSVSAFFEALLWPILPILTGLGYVLFVSARSVSTKIEAFVKEKVK